MGIGMKLYQGLYDAVHCCKAPNKNMKLVHTWTFGNKAPHAGQFFSTKTLPNGNVQKRMTTVYGNSALGLETAVYSPSGDLLKAYAGVRKAPYKDTESFTTRYASGNTKQDVESVVKSMYDHQYGAKSILF